jgi:hypothetical protein
MNRFDEHLFGRLAVFNRFLTKEQLQECLALQKAQDPSQRQPIGEVLVKHGYLTEKQLEEILEIRRKKLRKMLLDSKELVRTEKIFGRLALREGLITHPQLELALLEQQRLKRLNLQLCLGDIMISMGFMTLPHVLRVLSLQSSRILVCPRCDAHFTVMAYKPGRNYPCRHCKACLEEPQYLDTVATDGVIGDEISEASSASETGDGALDAKVKCAQGSPEKARE